VEYCSLECDGTATCQIQCAGGTSVTVSGSASCP
jgi:hypothetical protein